MVAAGSPEASRGPGLLYSAELLIDDAKAVDKIC